MDASWLFSVLLEVALCSRFLLCRPKPPLLFCKSCFLGNCIFLRTVLKITALPFCWGISDIFSIFGILLLFYYGVINIGRENISQRRNTKGSIYIIIQTSLCPQQLSALEKTLATLALFWGGNLATLSLPSLAWPCRHGMLNLRAYHSGTSPPARPYLLTLLKQFHQLENKYLNIWVYGGHSHIKQYILQHPFLLISHSDHIYTLLMNHSKEQLIVFSTYNWSHISITILSNWTLLSGNYLLNSNNRL